MCQEDLNQVNWLQLWVHQEVSKANFFLKEAKYFKCISRFSRQIIVAEYFDWFHVSII